MHLQHSPMTYGWEHQVAPAALSWAGHGACLVTALSWGWIWSMHWGEALVSRMEHAPDGNSVLGLWMDCPLHWVVALFWDWGREQGVEYSWLALTAQEHWVWAPARRHGMLASFLLCVLSVGSPTDPSFSLLGHDGGSTRVVAGR